jgi:hypothetical protein
MHTWFGINQKASYLILNSLLEQAACLLALTLPTK